MEASSGLGTTALTGMVTAVAGLACGDPVELIDHITELERLKNAAAAAQARLTVELRQVREAEARAESRNVKRVPASLAGEIGLARHESPHRASSLVGLAGVLTAEMPHTMTAFNAGDVSEWRVTVLARETACLSRAHRAHVDAALGPRLGDLSTRQLAAEARKLAYQLDPHSVVARIGKAEADRNVTIRPAPDCMTRVSALLPAADGVAPTQLSPRPPTPPAPPGTSAARTRSWPTPSSPGSPAKRRPARSRWKSNSSSPTKPCSATATPQLG